MNIADMALRRCFPKWYMLILVTRHADLVLPFENLADNRAADSLQLVQNKIDAYSALLHGFRMEIHSGLFNLVVFSACPSTMLNSQREVVAIFSGKVPTVLRIDGDFFHYSSLEEWAQKARMIVFHYHAFTLYNALLVDGQSIAMDAVKECQVWSDSVKGIASRNCLFSWLGTMIL